MVVLPVRLVSATESHRGRFREIHHRDGGRTRHKRVCEVEGTQEDIPYGDVGRAAELPDGRLVLITDEDLESPSPAHTARGGSPRLRPGGRPRPDQLRPRLLRGARRGGCGLPVRLADQSPRAPATWASAKSSSASAKDSRCCAPGTG
ncbi:Ku protein [Streptomyces nigrescens]